MSNVLVRMRSALHLEGVEPRHAEHMLYWASAFLSFGNCDDPSELNRNDVEAFLEQLEHRRDGRSIARVQVLDAIQRVYLHGGGVPAWLRVLIQEKTSGDRPNVLSPAEIRMLMARLIGQDWIIAALISETGLRVIECVRLRVRDLDLEARRLFVRSSQYSRDGTDRELELPEELIQPLRDHLNGLRREHIRDIAEGRGAVSLPQGIARSQPAVAVARKFSWQYLFAAPIPTGEARRDGECIHHLDPNRVHQSLARAAMQAGIYRRVNGHVLRSSFALQMLQKGMQVAELERMLGATRPAATTQSPHHAPDVQPPQPRPPGASA